MRTDGNTRVRYNRETERSAKDEETRRAVRGATTAHTSVQTREERRRERGEKRGRREERRKEKREKRECCGFCDPKKADIICFNGFCSVHQLFTVEDVEFYREKYTKGWHLSKG